jgi:D-3-phosphoglycerate dehydrogenase / 2-oxoglutarate reductase
MTEVPAPSIRPGPRAAGTAPPAPLVLVLDSLDPEGLALLRDAGFDVRVQTGLTPGQIAEAARDADAILVRSTSRVTAEILAAARRLRVVGRAGIGVDTIDVAAATRHGVLVMNTPAANAVSAGELALAHLFALARRLPAADASMKAGRWEKSALTGAEITGKTLAVVGLGKIGRVVAERGLGLQMRVIAHDPFLRGPSPMPGVALVDLDTALVEADFLTLHVPGGKDTAGLVGSAQLARMKRGSFLINCARGGIVDEGALLAALESGHLGGAALDVFATEPLPADSPLRRAPRLLLTPHLGASSAEAQKRVSTEICQQLVDFLRRGEARGAVNAPLLSPEALEVLRPYITLGERCGLLLAQEAGPGVQRVVLRYCGDLAQRPVDAVRLAVLAGLLAPALAGPVNAVNAGLLAAERGLLVSEEREPAGSEYTSLLRVAVTAADGAVHELAGTAFRGQPRLVEFAGFGVDFVPRGELLLTRHRDAPGVLGLVASWLGAHGINIGGLHMGAPGSGSREALALYQLDRALTPAELAELRTLPPLVRAEGLSLGA